MSGSLTDRTCVLSRLPNLPKTMAVGIAMTILDGNAEELTRAAVATP